MAAGGNVDREPAQVLARFVTRTRPVAEGFDERGDLVAPPFRQLTYDRPSSLEDIRHSERARADLHRAESSPTIPREHRHLHPVSEADRRWRWANGAKRNPKRRIRISKGDILRCADDAEHRQDFVTFK